MKHRYYQTEAEVQAILYNKLVDSGIQVGLEQKIQLKQKTRTGRSQSIRVDVGIFQDEKLVGAIEVKRGTKSVNKEGRQFAKYESLCLPFTYCFGTEGISDCVDWAKEILG